jgi:hypothetical protein
LRRVEFSIKHEYDRKLLKVENDLEVRLRAELVADLMAEWIKDKNDLDYHRLSHMSFQAFLWLPPNWPVICRTLLRVSLVLSAAPSELIGQTC